MRTIVLLASTAIAAIAARAGADDNNQAILDALNQLDPSNDEHWTADGLARIDTVKSLSGDTSITRETLEAARPGYNREIAGGENRTGNGMPAGVPGTSGPKGTGAAEGSDQAATGADGAAAAPPAPPEAGTDQATDPMAAALADGWAAHPTADGYVYKGEEVKANAEIEAIYTTDGGVVNTSQGIGQTSSQISDPAKDAALDISGQTGQGGAETARSPVPVEGELRQTEVDLPSQGAPGERPIGMTQGVTDNGVNLLGTPEGPVENLGRHIELSGEVAARNAGSVLTPSQAPANSDTPGSSISLGGAADPAVEARAPGGAAIAEGADLATVFEGPTAGGPFAQGEGQAQLGAVGDVDFDGDPAEVDALEAELETSEAKVNELRGRIDDLSGQLHTALRTSAQLRDRIVAATPRSANMTTIQTALASAHEARIADVEKRNKIVDALGGEAEAKRIIGA